MPSAGPHQTAPFVREVRSSTLVSYLSSLGTPPQPNPRDGRELSQRYSKNNFIRFKKTPGSQLSPETQAKIDSERTIRSAQGIGSDLEFSLGREIPLRRRWLLRVRGQCWVANVVGHGGVYRVSGSCIVPSSVSFYLDDPWRCSCKENLHHAMYPGNHRAVSSLGSPVMIGRARVGRPWLNRVEGMFLVL